MTVCTSASAAPLLVIFGDSLSDAGLNRPTDDTGNNFWARTTGKIGAPITSINPKSSTHPLWVNHIHTLKSHPIDTVWPKRLADKLKLDPATHHINYAWASAETGDHWLNDLSNQGYPTYADTTCRKPQWINDSSACVPGVLKQVQLYLNAVPHPNPENIYIIWAGGNDIFNNVTKILKIFGGDDKIKDLTLSHPVFNILQAKNKLIAAGANPKNIYIINLPDLSKIPAATRLAHNKPLILTSMHIITLGYNNALKMAVSYMPFSKNNLPDTNVLSIYSLFNQIMKNPSQHNITNFNNSCVADQKTPFCTGYVFFDNKHPTVKTGEIIAKWIINSISNST